MLVRLRGQSLPAISRFPQRREPALEGKMYPSLGSTGYSAEVLKTPLSRQGWCFVRANHLYTFFLQRRRSAEAFRTQPCTCFHTLTKVSFIHLVPVIGGALIVLTKGKCRTAAARVIPSQNLPGPFGHTSITTCPSSDGETVV